MRKFVYLFELDSVRRTDEEIIEGQKVLYDEIVKNGNIVILTCNQLIDSRAFFSLLDNLDYYESFIRLFEKGVIKISQYGRVRSLTQYLLNSIDNQENCFLYSALPIKNSQKRLIALIRRSLMYSDLTEIYEYIQRRKRTEKDIYDLFVEIKEKQETKTNLQLHEMENVLKNLYWFLGTLFRLSAMKDIYIEARDPIEYSKKYRFSDYLKYIERVDYPDPQWKESVNILKKLSCWGDNNRSNYFRELLKTMQNDQCKEERKKYYQYAEAILNICACYGYEVSICNVSKHYNIKDLDSSPNSILQQDTSFFQDFLSRLEQHWKNGKDADIRFLQEETNRFVEFERIDEIPNFEKGLRLVQRITEEENFEKVPRYEYKLSEQRRKNKMNFLKNVPRQIFSLLVALISVIAFNVVFEIIHNLITKNYESLMSWKAFVYFGIETIVFFILGEIITTIISKINPRFLSLSEAVVGIIGVFGDFCHVFFEKNMTYTSYKDVTVTENRNHIAPCEMNISEELKKYFSFYKENPDLVTPSSEYPIANIQDQEVVADIIRNEELYGQKYGIMYESKYNRMVVDPIINENNGIFPYERVVPRKKQSGVVIFPMCRGNVVLINQYRHAPRETQLCFPRGFGEEGLKVMDNAKKELGEELGAVAIKQPIELGTVFADSGLTSGKAQVYLVEIDVYKNTREEGIREVVEMPLEEFEQEIYRGNINDGFTLAAYAMYQAYQSSKCRNNKE